MDGHKNKRYQAGVERILRGKSDKN
jgi:hypothetical protein